MDERAAQVSHALGLDLGGLVLDGRYQIGRRLGAGGMAAVYEGRRVGLERRVAIKILRPELAENESNVRRFLREAKAASAISHPNVVSIEDVGGASRPVYFVMEFLDGVDLRQELRRLGRFDWPRTHDLAQQVVSALSAAHAVGIVHRDVKPANCFLVRETDGSERIKVLDFGIAKVLEESQEYTANVTATHGIVGTVAYMAPEQARSGTVDARTDVYALGTMLYEMLAGTVPFPDKNPFVVIGRLLGEAPVPLRMHRPDLSPELDAVVMTCLEKDPDARFQSMDALGAALGGCDREDAVVGTAKVRLPSGLVKQATVRPGVTAPPSVIVATTPLGSGATPTHATGPHATSLPGMPGAPALAPVRPPPSGQTAPQQPALPAAAAPMPAAGVP
ncbi:MAG: serine/threonine protein kinase, partial [Nannocystaceae bacterium]|nr:serine/threonine protein kinase [Nannocystaceae bacterium]